MEDIFRGYGVEIILKDPDDFLKVKETLTRIGVASKKDKTLYQSCHILHKKGRYRILHFKELFALDGKTTDMSENDEGRRNTITKLLADWGLINIPLQTLEELGCPPISVPPSQIKIISFKDKNEWILVSKYSIGTKNKY